MSERSRGRRPRGFLFCLRGEKRDAFELHHDYMWRSPCGVMRRTLLLDIEPALFGADHAVILGVNQLDANLRQLARGRVDKPKVGAVQLQFGGLFRAALFLLFKVLSHMLSPGEKKRSTGEGGGGEVGRVSNSEQRKKKCIPSLSCVKPTSAAAAGNPSAAARPTGRGPAQGKQGHLWASIERWERRPWVNRRGYTFAYLERQREGQDALRHNAAGQLSNLHQGVIAHSIICRAIPGFCRVMAGTGCV